LSLGRFGVLVVVVVVLACSLVMLRGVELREGYRIGDLLARHQSLSFSLDKARLEVCRLKAPRVLEERAIAFGVEFVSPMDKKLQKHEEFQLDDGGELMLTLPR